MINAVIIDDEANNILNLQRMLEKYCPGVNITGSADSAAGGIALINRHQPDLVFLDIHMPETNGLEMLQQLQSKDFALIFVTAFNQYGVQAVKFAAMDYLLKPVDPEELIMAVKKVSDNLHNKNQQQQLRLLVDLLQQGLPKDDFRIALPSLKETRFVNTGEIIRCESSNSYTHFFLSNGEKITVASSIQEYEGLLLPYGFLRPHQSHLVNRKYVRSLVKESGGYLLLQDGTQVPVSRAKKDEVKSRLSSSK
ncbi:LytTR family DNA-binding domain-containing protein [Chitinophaga sp. Cy-1792]|uniref:LytR/AlgR family response regulator transcription factor n=1 Tax=Chitinophaga sp. Cy-1792 TaxID=2608339 RepID=UPI001421C999|nr:LytTR family DNA-binding domain-containing protein [Chitinophaga sp. Cy-1792]NIG55499.1 response regulator transcription factor [Chitinophaga sp. Cy-1792]